MKTNLDYKLYESPVPAFRTIQTGSLTLRVYKREMKYDCWNGYEAYIVQDDKIGHFAIVSAVRWFPLLRKIAKLPGAKTL